MKGKLSEYKKRGLFLILTTALVLSGCAWYGAYIVNNLQVGHQFDTYQIYPGYHYYTCGTLEDPRAVLALKPGYRLNSKDWQPFEMTSEKLKKWVLALKKAPFVEFNTFSNGAWIIDNDGNVAGYYYSVWSFPIIRFSESGELLINKPSPVYRYYNGIRGRSADRDDMFGSH